MIKRVGFLIFIALIYVIISQFVTHSIFRKTDFSYFNYLTNALTHGRVNIISENVYDFSFYKGKAFMYWGPGPVLFILPFYLFSRLQASDVLYTLIAGIVNVIIFYFVILELIKFFKLKISDRSIYFIVLNFALASPNFYLSMGGKIWHTSQIISIFYLLVFLLFFFKFLNSKLNTLFFSLSAIFYGLAVISRQSLFFYILLFLFPFYFWKKNFPKARFSKILIGFGIFFSIIYFGYNYLRFENPLENGMRYGIGNSRYNKLVEEGKIFSVSYISHNFQYAFISPLSFKVNPPFIKWDPEGNSIFLVYPLLITLIFFIGSKVNANARLFLILSKLIAVTTILMILMFLGTGWFQFGSRYFLDVIPILFLSTLFIIERVPLPLKISILIFGVAVNLIGALTFPWFI